MNSSIMNKEDAFEGLLSKEHYFQSLLQVLYSNHLLDTGDMERLQLQLLELLAETAGYYTKDKSSSLPIETAGGLAASIYYTIGLFLKSRHSIKEAADAIYKQNLKHLFAQGVGILKTKLASCQSLYERVLKTRLQTDNQAYIDTLDYGIPLFFKEYDIRFASHDTPGSIDYPLSVNIEDLVGIEYMEAYLGSMLIENKLCACFQGGEIEALLKSYSKGSKHLLINVFELVLVNYLGRTLLGKEGDSLDITKRDQMLLKNVLENLSQEELESLIWTAGEKIVRALCMEEEASYDYVKKALQKLVREIEKHTEMNTLEKLFIRINRTQKKGLQFEDGKSLEDTHFRSVTEEIRACRRVADKVEIIRAELHSLRDLMDVFSADCLFEEEFIDVFKALEDLEIALLVKHVSDEVSWGTDYDTENEKEWHNKLRFYLETLDKEKRSEIIRMSEEIETQ